MEKLVIFLLLDQYATCLPSTLTGSGHTAQTVSLVRAPIRSMGSCALLPSHCLEADIGDWHSFRKLGSDPVPLPGM